MPSWNLSFLQPHPPPDHRALIVLNQPFSEHLLSTLWAASSWRCCADGGANRLHDLLPETRDRYLPDLIKGDLDSIRPDVAAYYRAAGVPVVHDEDQYSTDLMKCIRALEAKEEAENTQYELVLLGGLSGRLDQTVHTLSLLHRLRTTRPRLFAVTDDNVGWVLDAGEHTVAIDHVRLGPTCGLLPVGVQSTTLSTTGLRWDVTDWLSSFDTQISTSNHLDPAHNSVYIKTTSPIWWSIELRAP